MSGNPGNFPYKIHFLLGPDPVKKVSDFREKLSFNGRLAKNFTSCKQNYVKNSIN